MMLRIIRFRRFLLSTYAEWAAVVVIMFPPLFGNI